MFVHMKHLQSSNTQIRGYISPTPGLSIEMQRRMAADAGCKVVYENGKIDTGGMIPVLRWISSLRAGDTAWLPSVMCLVIPKRDRPADYRPMSSTCMMLNQILAMGVTIVDARARVSSRDPEAWAKHVFACSQRISSGTRTLASRRMAAKKATAAIEPGLKARWSVPEMAAKLVLQKALWTGAGTIKDARELLDEDLRRASTRTLYSLLGPRRPHDPKAGGRPPRVGREQPPRVRYVYFIQRGRTREVKIGSAYDVDARFSSLRTSSPDDLRLIGVLAGDHTTEKTLHKQFDEYWIRREWFKLEGELAEFIRRLPKHSGK